MLAPKPAHQSLIPEMCGSRELIKYVSYLPADLHRGYPRTYTNTLRVNVFSSFFFSFFFLIATVSLCSLGYPGTVYLDQANLKHTEICLLLPP